MAVSHAPIPAIRGTEIERQGSTLSGHSARLAKSSLPERADFPEWSLCGGRGTFRTPPEHKM
jgi:hypothetical protein